MHANVCFFPSPLDSHPLSRKRVERNAVNGPTGSETRRLRLVVRSTSPKQSSPNTAPKRSKKKGKQVSRLRRRLSQSTRSPRLVALEQLLRIEEDGAFIGLVSRKINSDNGRIIDVDENDDGMSNEMRQVDNSDLEPRDARYVKMLVAGVTRWRKKIDFILSSLSKMPLEEIDPILIQILRMGVCELIMLDSPPHIVNEYVEMAKMGVSIKYGGFVNGILRNLGRKKSKGDVPIPKKNDFTIAHYLSIEHSHPTWMVERWLDQFGEDDTVKLLEWNNRTPHHGLRLTSKLGKSMDDFLSELVEKGVAVRPSEYLPNEFLHVDYGMQTIVRGDAIQEGGCMVQDEAAGLVVSVLDPKPGERILDGCAAPGGKTLFSAERMNGKGQIVALDSKSSRLAALTSAARRQGFEDLIDVVHADLVDFASQHSTNTESLFDRVLVDAPCSGTGVLARRADLRWRRTEQQIEELKNLQVTLLEAGGKLVRPGGILVYSTCSIEHDENFECVSAFLENNLDFSLEPPDAGSVPSDALTDNGMMVILPFKHEIDGAFAARFRRKH